MFFFFWCFWGWKQIPAYFTDILRSLKYQNDMPKITMVFFYIIYSGIPIKLWWMQHWFTYITIIFFAVFPKVSNWKLFSYDNSASKDHHQANTDYTSRGVVQWKRVVENWVSNVSHIGDIVHTHTIEVKPKNEFVLHNI